jgi:hypothetical protein
MWARSTLLCGFLACVLAVCLAGKAVAELLPVLFPAGVPGYETQDGVTVETRLHPELMPLGVREGALLFLPQLDLGTGYNSNAQPGSHHGGSWAMTTAPSLTIGSDWSRNAIGAAFSVQDTRFPGAPAQDRTDATASLGGRIDIGGGALTLAAAHVSQHEDRSQLDTIASDRPIAFQFDDVRASYVVTAGRWSIEPALQATNWSYGGTTIQGQPASQSYRDRIVVQGGVTLRYEWAPLRNIVFVVRALGQDYVRTPYGQPSPDSTGYQMLAGIDYDDNAVWRWRLLAGGEVRRFANASYPQQNALIAEAGVGWAPTGMTTVNATISRGTEDAAQEGVSGLIYSAARITIDHEYLRDLLFKASIGLQRADFFQGGHQSGTSAGVGVTWLMNRSARLSFTYDQTDLRGSSYTATEALATGYSRGLGLVTLRLGL